MKRLIIFAAAVALFLTSKGDTLSEVDSLLHAYEQSKGTMRTAAGKALMEVYGAFPVFFDEPPQLADGMSSTDEDLIVWYATERFYTSCSYYAEALDYNARALDLVDSAHPDKTSAQRQDLLATLLCDKSYCLYKKSNYMEAIEALKRALAICQQSGNKLQLSRAYLYLALVNHALQNHDEAIEQVENAIRTNEQSGDDSQLHNTLGVACEIFCSARQTDKAIEYGLRAVEVARRLEFTSGVANHLLQLSYAYDRKGDYQKGISVADEAIALIKQGEPLDRNQLALALEYKSWNLIDIGRHREAAQALRQAISLEREVGNTHAAWNDYRTLAEALEPFDPHAAVEALRTYTRIGDSIHSEQLKQLTTKANAEFRNDELREENAESRRMNRIITWTAVIVVLMLIVAMASLAFAFHQKRRTNRALQQLVKARESFFTNVTHELRTPLTVILGVAKELQETPGAADLGAAIGRQGRQLLTLVNQMLDISKVKSALGPQPLTEGNVSAYVAMVVERHQEQARQKGVTVDFSTDDGGILATYVADYVEKMVDNLLSNAVKFTPKDGQVRVSLHREADHLLFTVSDTGCGIAKEHMPHIFEPFYRADSSGQIGSGVGLALVKQIVDALKGTIDVESQEGKGTTFRVRMKTTPPLPKGGEQWHIQGKEKPNSLSPLEGADVISSGKDSGEAHSGVVSGGAHSGVAHSGTGTSPLPLLLVVEDNPDVASFIGRQLESRYSISYASDGAEGIKKAHELMPDLIVTDLMMPGTDGLELCRTLRADEVTNHIPIIVVTAKATEADRIAGLQAGADAYLYKPFNADELQVRVEKLLELRELMRRKFSQTGEALDKESVGEAEESAFMPTAESFIKRVQQCVVELMPTRGCDVEHVAALLNLSVFQLRSKLTAITGITPKRYIVRIQLEQARQMLSEHPERKMLDVAERCGFYDQSHFTRLFREAFGLTPGEYAKQQMQA